MAVESLSDTLWDVVICGTDPNEYYGGAEAAFSLQEAEKWAASVSTPEAQAPSLFKSASITKPENVEDLSFPRAYSLALAPQLIYARSELLSQLVSSRAYRQVDFLAVGSFFIVKSPSAPSEPRTLVRIPSTREDVFSTSAISVKAKRGLMKFLKFVVDFDNPENSEKWKPHAQNPLFEFLQDQFKMDTELQTYIITLTLSLDGRIETKEGLAIIHRHLSSMGVYGPGFAAIYPKWGGISEIAQVSCRAGAVGGAVYMLGTGIKGTSAADDGMELELTSGDKVKTRMLVRGYEDGTRDAGISRLVAVIGSPLKFLFEAVVEGAPIPGVAIVAFPAGSLTTAAGNASASPVYVFAHSSDTGECPTGQSVLYLTAPATPDSKELLDKALEFFLSSVGETPVPQSLYHVYYEQYAGMTPPASGTDDLAISFPAPSFSLSFDDTTLDPVRGVWKRVMGETAIETDYMAFPDREGAADDDIYD